MHVAALYKLSMHYCATDVAAMVKTFVRSACVHVT
jgi:hypothetical protein